MLVTVMGGTQVRVIQAHVSGQFLVLSKTKVFDLATKQMAIDNTDALLGLMGSDQVGDPADTDHNLKFDSEAFVGSAKQVVTQQGSENCPNKDTGNCLSNLKRFQSIREFFRPARKTSAASRESQKSPTPGLRFRKLGVCILEKTY